AIELSDLIDFIRRSSLAGRGPVPLAPGSSQTDITPPVISSVIATRLSATSIRVDWTTDKPTLGLAAAGSPASAGTTAPYNVWSIESSYGTSHSVVIIGLPTATPTHFAVLSKDMAGNSSRSPDAVL